MATIYIQHSATATQEKAVQQVIEQALINDVNWSGAVISLERDDFTWIDTTDEVSGSILLRKVYQALESN